MKKLSLDMDSLTVQSFATESEGPATEGTVVAFLRIPVEPTGPNAPDCSHIDRCASAMGCTHFECETFDLYLCFTRECEFSADCDTGDLGC